MPRLYVFRITHLPTRMGSRVAVLIKGEKDPELTKINPRDITNYFDKDRLPNHGVDYKGSIEVGDDIYQKVIDEIDRSGPNPSIKIINEGGKFTMHINNKAMLIASFFTKIGAHLFVEYPLVYIKN